MITTRLFSVLFSASALLTISATAALRADWPEYRGPWASGHASSPDSSRKLGLPLRWSESENIVWKTRIPHRGWSTPVILDDKIWLTTATEDGHDFFVICVDAVTGDEVFRENLFHCESPEPLGNDLNCYASPSAVVEPGRVYISFGSYGTACLDTASFETIWTREDLPCRHFRGPGSSPIIYDDLLILTMDGVDVQYVAALNKQSGKSVWRTDRSANWNDLGPGGKPIADGDYRKGYSTPLIISSENGTQMISSGAKAAYGYDPLTGNELWKVQYKGHSSAARPIFGNGKAFIITGFGDTQLLAVNVDGHGDVTDTHVDWRVTRSVSRMPSPILSDDLIYLISDRGVATCLDALTGQAVWRQRVAGQYAASLLYGDGRIYCFNQEGTTSVLKAGREFELLAKNKLDAGFMSSPAVCGNSLILRTKTHLYRIGSE